MTNRYASLLASAKFRTRLGRSIITVIAASLVASIMLVASLVSTGIEKGVRDVSETKLSRMNLAIEYWFSPMQAESTEEPEAAPVPAPTIEDYTKDMSQYGAVAIYKQSSLGSFTEKDAKPSTSPADPLMFSPPAGTGTIAAQSDKLYEAHLDTDNPPTPAEGTIPAIISRDYVLRSEGIQFTPADSAKTRIEKTTGALAKWRGKQVTWIKQNGPEAPSTELTLTVQGFTNGSGPFGQGASAEILVPSSKVPDSATSTQSSEMFMGDAFYLSFNSEEELLGFVEKFTKEQRDKSLSIFDSTRFVTTYGNAALSFRELRGMATTGLKYVLLALLIAVSIAMLTTLSKIIADSERETGVFRAIGARAADILHIYLTYSVFISVVATTLAFAVSLALSYYLTARFGAALTYELISLSGTSNLDANISLIGFNPLHLVGVFGAILAAAIVGAILPLYSLLRKDPINALRAE
jgi:hypothetical protein